MFVRNGERLGSILHDRKVAEDRPDADERDQADVQPSKKAAKKATGKRGKVSGNGDDASDG